MLRGQIVVVGGLTAEGAPRRGQTRSRRRRSLAAPARSARRRPPSTRSVGRWPVYVAGGYGGRSPGAAANRVRVRRRPLARPSADAGAPRGRGRRRRRRAVVRGRRRRRRRPRPAGLRPGPAHQALVGRAGADTARASRGDRGRWADLRPRRAEAGYDTNVATFESWTPGEKRWRRLPDVPRPRGGTGAAVAAGRLVSVGGEEPAGTIASVYAWDIARGRWSRLPDLRTPRHGLGVVAVGTRVYAVGGGPTPGLAVSGADEYLDLK